MSAKAERGDAAAGQVLKHVVATGGERRAAILGTGDVADTGRLGRRARLLAILRQSNTSHQQRATEKQWFRKRHLTSFNRCLLSSHASAASDTPRVLRTLRPLP